MKLSSKLSQNFFQICDVVEWGDYSALGRLLKERKRLLFRLKRKTQRQFLLVLQDKQQAKNAESILCSVIDQQIEDIKAFLLLYYRGFLTGFSKQLIAYWETTDTYKDREKKLYISCDLHISLYVLNQNDFKEAFSG